MFSVLLIKISRRLAVITKSGSWKKKMTPPLNKQLRKYLKRLMIYKSVDIKELKHIERWMHRNASGALDKCVVLMYRQEMDGSIDRIEMNNSKTWITIIICVRFDHPESCVLIRFGAHMRIGLNQCTRIFFVLMLKRKEKEDTCNLKPTNAFRVNWNLGIWVDQNRIVTCFAFPPWWSCSDMFTPHATNAADITRGVKCCDSWVTNMNSSLDSGMCILRQWCRCWIIMKLII